MESNCLLPVEMRTTFLRWWKSSMAVMNPDVDGWVGSMLEGCCFSFSLNLEEREDPDVPDISELLL
jgi:hypothetical protein